jgi:hypothetical protein
MNEKIKEKDTTDSAGRTVYEIIQVENLSKTYRSYKGAKEVHALNGIDLTVLEGEFIGIMGPSGSGKTTLLNVLSGIDTATGGDVIVGGKNISGMKKDDLALFRRRNIGYIFQDFIGAFRVIQIFVRVRDSVFQIKIDVYDVQVARYHFAFFGYCDGVPVVVRIISDCLFKRDVYVHEFRLLDERDFKMDSRVYRDPAVFAEGRDDCLLFVVDCVIA